jgi:putative flippase GtrA
MTLSGAFGPSGFIRFLLAGGVAALVNVLSRLLYSQAVSYTIAVVAAYLTGMATAYVLNRLLVFGPGDRSVSGEMLAFALVNLLAVAQTLVISVARLLCPARVRRGRARRDAGPCGGRDRAGLHQLRRPQVLDLPQSSTLRTCRLQDSKARLRHRFRSSSISTAR